LICHLNKKLKYGSLSEKRLKYNKIGLNSISNSSQKDKEKIKDLSQKIGKRTGFLSYEVVEGPEVVFFLEDDVFEQFSGGCVAEFEGFGDDFAVEGDGVAF
jgi:hypothetical protein